MRKNELLVIIHNFCGIVRTILGKYYFNQKSHY